MEMPQALLYLLLPFPASCLFDIKPFVYQNTTLSSNSTYRVLIMKFYFQLDQICNGNDTGPYKSFTAPCLIFKQNFLDNKTQYVWQFDTDFSSPNCTLLLYHPCPKSRPLARNIPYWARSALMIWLIGWFALNGPLRQYFSLYRVVTLVRMVYDSYTTMVCLHVQKKIHELKLVDYLLVQVD